MCQFKSGIILKDRVFLPDYDSHTEMLEELKIKDTRANAERLFIRAELLPPRNDIFAPIEEWSFQVDQDILPDWYVASYDEQRMRDAVKEWAKNHIHMGVDNLKIDSGKNHYIKDCKNVVICDSASVKYIYGSASVKYICDSASVENICDSASVKYICDSASVKYICGSASVENICDSASVENICDLAIVASSPHYDWKNKDKIILSQNATFKDNRTKTLWQSGDWKVQIIKGDKNAE